MFYENTETGEFGITFEGARQRAGLSAPMDTPVMGVFRAYAFSGAPPYNPLTHGFRESRPMLVNGMPTQQWEVFALTDAEIADAVANKVSELRRELRDEYERRTQALGAPYPPTERESWPVQTAEAAALLANPESPTPWIDAASQARGIPRLELAHRIAAMDSTYRRVHGALTGTRQRIDDEIGAAGDDPHALLAIDVKADWPELN